MATPVLTCILILLSSSSWIPSIKLTEERELFIPIGIDFLVLDEKLFI